MNILNNDNFLKILIGRTITKIENIDDDELILHFKDGFKVKFYHDQDCCENVYIEDIDGDLDNLLNTPLLMCEESTNTGMEDKFVDSVTWTYYKFASVKGYVTVRWLGESNGYYSESVDIEFASEQDFEDGYIGDNFIISDGYISHYKKITVLDGVKYYIGHELVVATKNGKTAHGKNIRSALMDLNFKLAERHKHDYRRHTLETTLPYEEAVVMYRVITGACKMGTEQFLKSNNIEIRPYSVNEIIDLTKGHYGSKIFIEFFNKRN